MVRDEVVAASGNVHLGHVFDDGPADKGGMRYRMKLGCPAFIPAEDLDKEGYGQYRALFKRK